MAWPLDFPQWSCQIQDLVVSRVLNALGRTVRPSRGLTELARDAIQDAFLEATRRTTTADAFVSPDHLANWLTRVAVNRAISALRRERKKTPLANPEILPAPSKALVEDIVWTKALAALTVDDRRLLYYSFVLDWTDAQIGNQLNIPAMASFRRRHQVLRRLRQHFLREQRDPEEWEIPESILQGIAQECAELSSEQGS